MEESKTPDKSKKSTGNTASSRVHKPASSTSKTITSPRTTAQNTGSDGSTETSLPKTPPASAAAEAPATAIIPAPEKEAKAVISPAVTQPDKPASVSAKKSKKLAIALKKLKNQKKEITQLEKKHDRLMKDLISAIENKKKSKQIWSMARDFTRLEKKTKKKTSVYLRAKKKLAK